MKKVASTKDYYNGGHVMAKVYLFLTEGFEEIEAITQIDLLRRAGVTVTSVSITGKLLVQGSHGIEIMADILFNDSLLDADMLVLPGGPGTKMLMQHDGLKELILKYNDAKKYLAAICAAPGVFGVNQLLVDKKAICFPGHEANLPGAILVNQPVVEDDNFITSKGAGTSIDFGLALIAKLCGSEISEQIGQNLQYER
jgi:4-methyl-5(b-hydroxyethyl)-thiazole monophosphate biosynthesis